MVADKALRDAEAIVTKLADTIATKLRPAAEADAVKFAEELAAIDIAHDALAEATGRREATDPAKTSKKWAADVQAAEKKFAEESKRFQKSPEEVTAIAEAADLARVSHGALRCGWWPWRMAPRAHHAGRDPWPTVLLLMMLTMLIMHTPFTFNRWPCRTRTRRRRQSGASSAATRRASCASSATCR